LCSHIVWLMLFFSLSFYTSEHERQRREDSLSTWPFSESPHRARVILFPEGSCFKRDASWVLSSRDGNKWPTADMLMWRNHFHGWSEPSLPNPSWRVSIAVLWLVRSVDEGRECVGGREGGGEKSDSSPRPRGSWRASSSPPAQLSTVYLTSYPRMLTIPVIILRKAFRPLHKARLHLLKKKKNLVRLGAMFFWLHGF
jgi:hypothetical protein